MEQWVGGVERAAVKSRRLSKDAELLIRLEY